MIPTSLDLAGFAPAQASLSLPGTSLQGTSLQGQAPSSNSQDGPGVESQGGASFRQVMNSYRQSHEEDKAGEDKPKEAKQTGKKQDPQTDVGSAVQAPAPAPAKLFTGKFGIPQAEQQDGQPSLKDVQAGEAEAGALQQAAANASAQTPLTGASGTGALANGAWALGASATGASALQLLLKGGPQSQGTAWANIDAANIDSANIAWANIAGANQSQPAAQAVAQAVGSAGGAGAERAMKQLGGHSAEPPVGKAFEVGAARAGTAKPDKSKSGKAQGGSAQATAERQGVSGAGLPVLADNNVPIAAPQAGVNGSDGGALERVSSSDNGVPVSGRMTPEALQAGAAEQNGNRAAAAANNFAFALRLTAEGGPAATPEAVSSGAVPATALRAAAAAQPALAAAAAGESGTAGGGESGGQAGPGGGQQPEALAGAAMMFASEALGAGQTAHASSPPASPSATPAAAVEPEVAAGLAVTEPVRNVRLQLTGDNNQRVDIRLMDVGGEMRVSVRAGDTKLASNLQEHLPDLTKNLNQQQFRTEVWTPRSESTSQTNGSNAGGQSSRGGDSPGPGGQQQRQGSGRQQQNQPDWVDEFENYSGPIKTTRSN